MASEQKKSKVEKNLIAMKIDYKYLAKYLLFLINDALSDGQLEIPRLKCFHRTAIVY